MRPAKSQIGQPSADYQPARGVLELMGDATRIVRPGTLAVGAFWWSNKRNFGDGLTRALLPHFNVVPVRRFPGGAEVCGVGSLLHLLHSGYDGYLWGTGAIDGTPLSLPYARPVAVRGKFTAEILSLSSVPNGDPGLMVARVTPKTEKRWAVGVVPHYSHADAALEQEWARRPDVKVINVRRPPSQVIADIASCGVILTSSLHGLIVADALGIPASWFNPEPVTTGGAFKFLDHESVVGPAKVRQISVSHMEDLDVDVAARGAQVVDASVVREVISGLERATSQMVNMIRRDRRWGRSAYELAAGFRTAIRRL